MVDLLQEDKLFFPVPGVKLQDLPDWQDKYQRSHHLYANQFRKNERLITESLHESNAVRGKYFGNKVTVNDEEIALFRLGDDVYAIQATCPHAGGPLYLGDIEELTPGQLCLKCPWHKWTFDINTGQCVLPRDRDVVAKTYPVRVAKSGQIFIGFDSFGPSAFDMDF